jgi:PAS domain S-box-containing protein
MVDGIRRLRIALRDLVALSTIPAAWVGRDPTTITEGLAEVLMVALHLDFVFVRLHDCHGGAPIDAARGNWRRSFPAWLQKHLAAAHRSSQQEFIVDLGDDRSRCRGVIVPIGFDAASGLVAAVSRRPDFPTETDRLLLGVATNHAAMAFQSAQLIRDLRLAEERLRQAHDELEVKVRERTHELRRTSAELETIFDASPLGMVLVRDDQTVQRCNSAFERLVGWTADEVVGRRIPLTEAIEQQRSRVAAQHDNGHGFSGVEIRMTRKDGSEFDAALACAPLADEDGHLSGLVANIEDISDRKRSEDALRKAQAELAHVTRLSTLGEMVASIAHEINQPLTAILANAAASLHWLAKPNPELDLVRGALADMVADGHRAGDVIQRIRQLATKTDPKRTRLNVNDVIQEAGAHVRSEMQKHRVSLCAALAPDLPPTLGDRVQLQQVVINLVMNAVEAMTAVCDRPRELAIRSDARDDLVFVAVQDAGVGFEPSDADRLFDAFFTTKRGGMGIGLSISRSIIEAHGGRLWATLNGTHGATFQFTLPAVIG